MPIHRAGIRIRRKVRPFAWLFELARITGIVALLVVFVIGGYRYLFRSSAVVALQFTQHVVGDSGAAVGVLGVAVADMQRDGRRDIITAGKNGVRVYIQQSNGTFQEKIIDDIKAERVIVQDFDKDGLPDMLVNADHNPGIRLYMNNGDAEFTKTWLGSGTGTAIAVGDIDGDGAKDFVSSTLQGDKYVLERWMNNGSGTFAATTLSADSGVKAIAIADINGNHYNDIIIGGSQGLQHYDTGNGATWNREDIDDSLQNGFTSIAMGDVNGDGGTDIVVADQSTNSILYYRHIQHSAFDRLEVATDIDATTVQVVDFNEDGNTDIVVSAQDDNSVYWYEGNGEDAFAENVIATNIQSVFGVAVSDVDGDGDYDFVAGDHFRGTVYWYERTHAKPTASNASAIAQMTDGTGRIVFTTDVVQEDSFPTNLRVEYSTDSKSWYKAYLSSVTADKGKVDVNFDNPYQIGTTNAIDTDTNDSVKLTIVWDTKSTKNLGSPIVSDTSNVKIRLIPRDSVGLGNAVISTAFRIDNSAPKISGSLKATNTSESGSVELTWNKPDDGSSFDYRVYYGTDSNKVKNQDSDAWDDSNDSALNEGDTTSTTITGLSAGDTVTFKLVAKDSYGNEVAWPSVSTLISTSTSSTAEATVDPFATPSPTPTFDPNATPTPAPIDDIIGGIESPTPSPTPIPTIDARPPIADAGPNQTVNPSSLVILDGSASSDVNGDALSYSWTQLSGSKVELLSDRTANPSFSAGTDGGSYIFQLTVKNSVGASAIDLVTIGVKPLPAVSAAPIVSATPLVAESILPTPVIQSQTPSATGLRVLVLSNIVFLVLSLLVTSITILHRAIRGSSSNSNAAALLSASRVPSGHVVHYRTGMPIAGAQVMIYGADGKLRSTQSTNERGEFPSTLPAGEYTIGTHAPGFISATSAASSITLSSGIVYTGGKVTVTDENSPLTLVIPMKPAREEVSSSKMNMIVLWQTIERFVSVISWPVLIVGALVNTSLVFLSPGFSYLGIEVLYVVIIIVKVALEVHTGPAYGLVRNAVTHVPLDLAIVRLFDQKTNRLVMTRIANAEGKFFALPSSGTYMISVTKEGYAPFTRDHVVIDSGTNSLVQITADLMPLVPVAAQLHPNVKAGLI